MANTIRQKYSNKPLLARIWSNIVPRRGIFVPSVMQQGIVLALIASIVQIIIFGWQGKYQEPNFWLASLLMIASPLAWVLWVRYRIEQDYVAIIMSACLAASAVTLYLAASSSGWLLSVVAVAMVIYPVGAVLFFDWRGLVWIVVWLTGLFLVGSWLQAVGLWPSPAALHLEAVQLDTFNHTLIVPLWVVLTCYVTVQALARSLANWRTRAQEARAELDLPPLPEPTGRPLPPHYDGPLARWLPSYSIYSSELLLWGALANWLVTLFSYFVALASGADAKLHNFTLNYTPLLVLTTASVMWALLRSKQDYTLFIVVTSLLGMAATLYTTSATSGWMISPSTAVLAIYYVTATLFLNRRGFFLVTAWLLLLLAMGAYLSSVGYWPAPVLPSPAEMRGQILAVLLYVGSWLTSVVYFAAKPTRIAHDHWQAVAQEAEAEVQRQRALRG